MRALTDNELERMQDTQVEAMNDLCDILVWASSSDDYTDGLDTWPTSLGGVQCGFAYERIVDQDTGRVTIQSGRARLRLALDQAISDKDKVLARDTEWLVDGIVDGPTCKLVYLRKAETDGD